MEGVTKISWLPHLCVCIVCAVMGGCALHGHRHSWRPPAYALPGEGDAYGQCPPAAESAYAAAVAAEMDGAEACVDFYFEAAMSSWQAIERSLVDQGFASQRSMDLNRSAVAKLLINAQRFGRWHPGRGLLVCVADGHLMVPIHFRGFAWESTEFQYLEPVGDYNDDNISRRFCSNGIGVPLVVSRHSADPQPFTQARQTFAATALVRSCHGAGRIELSNPLNCASTMVAACRVPLARDTSAPFALANQGDDRLWIENFIRPETDGTQNRLFMIEPYQRSKIPVVFVHGLLSEPKTWVDLVNDLRVRPELHDRYQWWAYRYATGGPFLESAAGLRQQLKQIRRVYDPLRTDPAMSRIVLIGHSMGGLVCKLQVTESSDRLWRSIAHQPLQSVHTTPDVRQQLYENFFFTPSCDVSRVVFIGTPHQGSPWARRPIGRLASAMVEPSATSRTNFEQLVRDNPHLLRGVETNRFPTSIDLMDPNDPLLRATATLPFAPYVSVHSIVGVARTTWDGESSDGIVPVSSAQLGGVMTERQVDAKHTQLHRDLASVEEIACILQQHLLNN